MHKRIYVYLEENRLLTDQQWGFPPGRSRLDAGAGRVEMVLDGLNNRQHVGVVYNDFQKAFESINHTCLIGKLNMYRIQGSALDWCYRYLNDRKQHACVNRLKSTY